MAAELGQALLAENNQLQRELQDLKHEKEQEVAALLEKVKQLEESLASQTRLVMK